MVIMKMLSNNKGAALVILIIAMMLIAVMGASFVSLVTTKQKREPVSQIWTVT